MDGLMCYGIIRVNVKNGKVKKLFFERSSSSVLPEPGFEFPFIRIRYIMHIQMALQTIIIILHL